MLWFLPSFLLLLALLLWLPLELEIDTNHGVYRARWRGIFGIRGVPGKQGWRSRFTKYDCPLIGPGWLEIVNRLS